ncbi:MAG: YdcF family protein [Clostridiales bacterium]|nr:YdcF family protein [Clostridiales bacterium]
MMRANEADKRNIPAAVVRAALAAAGLMLVLNAVFLAFNANFTIGIVFTAVLGVALLVYSAAYRRLSAIKWLSVVIRCALASFVCLVAIIAICGRMDTVTYQEDALLVLGAAVRGETPAYPLHARLEAAVEYHKRNPDAVIVVSGGQGFQESITEALAMERRLLDRGIPADKIVKEERATSTYENFLFSQELLDQHFGGPYKIAFITSDFHVLRASVTAKRLGLRASHLHAPILWQTIPSNYLRECAAVLRELLAPRR